MTQDPREALICAALYERVSAETVERAETALGEIIRERGHLYAVLEELLDVAERIRGGDRNLDPERWFAIRDAARVALALGSTP